MPEDSPIHCGNPLFLSFFTNNNSMKTLRLSILTLCIILCSQTSYSQNFDVNTLASIENTRTPFMNQAMEGISFSAYIMAPAVPISILSMGLATSNPDATIGGLQIGASILLSTATTFAMKKIYFLFCKAILSCDISSVKIGIYLISNHPLKFIDVILKQIICLDL